MRTKLLLTAGAGFVLIACLLPGGVRGQDMTTSRDRAAIAAVDGLARKVDALLPRVTSLEAENARLRRRLRTVETRFDQWRRTQLEPLPRPEGEQARLPEAFGSPGHARYSFWW